MTAEQRAHYARPGSAFGHTLFEIGLTPRLLQQAEYDFLPQFELGLSDLNWWSSSIRSGGVVSRVAGFATRSRRHEEAQARAEPVRLT